MLTTGTTSSPLLSSLQFLPALRLLCAFCIYVVGLVLAYVAFLHNRKAAIKSVRSGMSAESRVISPVRSTQITSSDRREALIAAAIWPVLLFALLASPVWVAGWFYNDRRSKANTRRSARLAHS